MSSLKNLRQRFNKSDRDDRHKDGAKAGQAAALTEEDVFEVIESSDDRATIASDDTQSCASFPSEELISSLKWNSPEERKVFEEQLNQLQEQLMMVMIENQSLKSELNSNKYKAELEVVQTELAYERHRCEHLEKKLEQGSKKKSPKVHRSHSDLAARSRLTVPGSVGGSSSSISGSGALSDGEDIADGTALEIPIPVTKKKRFYHSFTEYVLDSFYTFLDDFTEEPASQPVGDPDGDPLTVKTLKENIKRFGTEATPYVNTIKGIYELLAWKSAPYTLICFVVYMYSVWQGWFLPVLLFCLTFRLFVNFLRHRGWNVSFNFFETVEETKDTEEKDLGVSDKFNLVMQVARKVQNFLGEVADGLEKIKSLLTWRHPEASRQLFLTIGAAFITSCILPTPYLFFYMGLALGIKLFIVDYLYNRFPRVKRKYDSTYRLWQELPTDAQYEKRYIKSEIDKYILPYGQEKGEVTIETKSDQVSLDDRTFCELFSLPDSECPLPGWHGGRRCTLINREKSLTAAFKNGRLYLTHSFLCFERTKVPSPKNIVIPLADIARLEKAKPYSWMPGGGMAIEIAVVGNDKPYIFGAILNRDEVLDSIVTAGRKAGLSWSSATRCPSPTE